MNSWTPIMFILPEAAKKSHSIRLPPSCLTVLTFKCYLTKGQISKTYPCVSDVHRQHQSDFDLYEQCCYSWMMANEESLQHSSVKHQIQKFSNNHFCKHPLIDFAQKCFVVLEILHF